MNAIPIWFLFELFFRVIHAISFAAVYIMLTKILRMIDIPESIWVLWWWITHSSNEWIIPMVRNLLGKLMYMRELNAMRKMHKGVDVMDVQNTFTRLRSIIKSVRSNCCDVRWAFRQLKFKITLNHTHGHWKMSSNRSTNVIVTLSKEIWPEN